MRVVRYKEMLAIIAVDIDNFKSVNEAYGTQQGNLLLQEFAHILNLTIRKYVDIPCRFGNDRFVVLLPKSDLQGSMVLADRLRNNCEKYNFTGQEEPLKSTLSGGVTVFDVTNVIPMEKLISQTMEMLEKAKEEGGNRILVWEY